MTRAEMKLRLVLTSLLFLVAVGYTVTALGFHELARYTPVTVGSLASLLLAAAVIREVLRLRDFDPVSAGAYGRSIEHVDEGKGGVTTESLHAALRYALWILGYLGVMSLVGLTVASALYVGLFLLVDARVGPRFAAISVAGVVLFLWVFGSVIGFVWPEGVFFPR